VDGEATTEKVKPVGKTLNMKVVDATVEPEVPVTVMTALVTIWAVDEAVSAAETLHVRDGRDGVQVAVAGVNTTFTPVGRAERLKTTGAATPAVVVADRVSRPAAPP
jgi:hypothetical protein